MTGIKNIFFLKRKDFYRRLGFKGFSLAEVLITLFVMGIVAAITIPIIISNHQKRVWVSQLKKSSSMFSQGFNLWMTNEGVYDMINTRAFVNDVDIYSKSLYPAMGYTQYRVANFFKDMKKYFKIIYIGPIENYTYKMLGPGTTNKTVDGNHVIVLSDGTMFYNYNFSTANGYANIEFYLDVNGTRGPNILGRDIFHVSFIRNGKFYSKFWHKLCDPRSKNDPTANGLGCVEKIVNDGWEMNY